MKKRKKVMVTVSVAAIVMTMFALASANTSSGISEIKENGFLGQKFIKRYAIDTSDIEPKGEWQLLLTDPDEPEAWMDLKEIYTKDDGTNIYFKVVFYESWPGDPHEYIDTGILLDVDQNPHTGMNSTTSWYPYGVNDIGADYLAVVGYEGDSVWKWNDYNESWDYCYANFTYLDLQSNRNYFEVGFKLSDIGNPSAIDIVIVNIDVASDCYWDYAPAGGDGHATYNIGVTDDDNTFSFSVLGVGDYVYSPDLNNWDADLTYIIAELLGDVDQNEHDAAVEPDDFYDEDTGADPPGADVSDLLYFTGHGSPGEVMLCDGTKEYSLDYNDIENNSDGWDLDLEWALFASCDTLEDDNWKVVLQHGAHILCGYDGITLDYVDTWIIYRFFKLAALFRLPIVDSWKYANLLAGEGDWKCIFHEGNRNDHLWGFGSVGQDYLGTDDIIIYKTASQKSSRALNKNLTSTIVSDKREVVSPLISVTLSFREIKETFNYFGFNDKEIKEMEFRGEKAYYATDNAHTVIVYPSGATIYFADHSDPKDENSEISISKQEAITIAKNFIEEHGGLSEDSYLESVMPVVRIKDGSTSVDGFIIKYGRKHDDMKICGYTGDGIVIEVGANGDVRYFYKLWRNIARTSGKKYVTISAKECLEKALPQIQRLIKGDRYTISNMELVYYSESFNKEQREIIPAWKIDIADPQGRADDHVFIDATSGKLIIP